jgi:hypothetical protein
VASTLDRSRRHRQSESDNSEPFTIILTISSSTWGSDTRASDERVYSVYEVERMARVAGHMARSMALELGWSHPRVLNVDKSNVLASCRLWRKTVTRVMAGEFPDVQLSHGYVDSVAMQMVWGLGVSWDCISCLFFTIPRFNGPSR